MNPDRPSPERVLKGPDRSARVSAGIRARVHVTYDTEHDADLYALLRKQSQSPHCGFSVMSGSGGSSQAETWQARVRSQIREADLAIIICGKHTAASMDIHAELLIAIEEEKPHFLLWGRREVMCSKPTGALRDEGMFGWTGQILQDQIDFHLRQASIDAEAMSLRRVTPTGRKRPADAAPQNEAAADPATARRVR